MNHLALKDVLSIEEYERKRSEIRAKTIALKKTRRVFLGPEMSLLFENRQTVLMQVQEIARAEKIVTEASMLEELAVYNELIPPPGHLSATLMIEISDGSQRELRRRDYVGLEQHIHLALGGTLISAKFDRRGLHDGVISVVQYVTFELPADAGPRLLDHNQSVELRSTHPRYGYSVTLTHDTRASLASDLATD
ncbi:MAG: DUF3501 family protein [Deltaproteobacteria bacterium]|nr:DUF3501 family protein [Deltaproteobacteria bacterium]